MYYTCVYIVTGCEVVVVNVNTARSLLSHPPKVDRGLMGWEGAALALVLASLVLLSFL